MRAVRMMVPGWLLLMLSGCDSGVQVLQAAEDQRAQVRTVRVEAAETFYELRLPAQAQAGERALLYARATGVVAERRVDLGDWVEQGQVLAIVSAPEIDQAVRQAEAELQLAEANLRLARTNYQRAERLIASGSISREVHDERLASFNVASAARVSAAARLANLREQQDFQSVRAPFAGVISARNIERGDRVVGDQGSVTTPMFELSSLDPLRIVVDVPQSAVLQVRAGLQAQVLFPEMPGEGMDVEVVRVARSISAGTGGMRTELRMANPDNRIPVGMSGQVMLRVPRSVPALLVPIAAVIHDGSGAQVVRLDGDSGLDYRAVRLGRNLGNQVEVLDGLDDGDQVVLSPNALLKPDTRVQVATSAPRG